jgi:CelD/BcsL family acetyltransferase involved in cellulose biosynthesis
MGKGSGLGLPVIGRPEYYDPKQDHSSEPMHVKQANIMVETFVHLDDLADIRDDWNRLLAASCTQSVELTYEWQATHWKYFHDDAELYLLVASDESGIVGIAPLKITRAPKYGITLRTVELIAAVESNYQDFIYPAERCDVLEAMLAYLADHHQAWDICTLRNLPDVSPTVQHLLNHRPPPFFTRIANVERCIFLNVDQSWSEHVQKLPKKSRQEIANRTRRLEKQGAVAFVRCDGGERFSPYLDQFFKIHQKRWNQTSTPSMFNDPDKRQYYAETITALCAQNRAELYALELDETPIAFLLTLVMDRAYLIQLIAYDPDHSKSAPSIVMHEFFVQQVFEKQAKLIDFGQHYEYKELWADSFKEHMTIKLYAHTIRGRYVLLQERWNRYRHEHLRRYTPTRAIQFAQKKLASLTSRSSGSTSTNGEDRGQGS